MNADSARYVRITHRLALGVSSEDDEASQALAALLEGRILDAITLECAPQVTSDLLSERLAQAAAALREHGVILALGEGRVAVERCFCETYGCKHASALLGRLLGVAVESIITNEGRSALGLLGAIDESSYTETASMNASRLRS